MANFHFIPHPNTWRSHTPVVNYFRISFGFKELEMNLKRISQHRTLLWGLGSDILSLIGIPDELQRWIVSGHFPVGAHGGNFGFTRRRMRRIELRLRREVATA